MTDPDAWIAGLAADVPDPFAPLYRAPPEGDANVRVARQRRQRAVILGVTRRLVATEGVDSVHLQAIAERSGVSVQTLYNLVGNRQDILGAAATEWVVALARAAVDAAIRDDTNLIFTTLEIFWVAAIVHREYNRNMVRSRAHHGFLRPSFLKAGTLALVSHLRDLRSRGALVRWADPTMIAETLATACHTHISEWLDRPYAEDRFRRRLVNSCGLLLRGVLAGEEIARLERRLDPPG